VPNTNILLIKNMKQPPCKVTSSLDISSEYTKDYYTENCGGFEVYKKNQGKLLEDLRLQAVATLAGIKRQGRVLDLGCGRGELTYFFAKQGFEVTAVDYSPHSIELAKKCFAAEYELQKNVRFYCESVCNVTLNGLYDLVVASDLIEHLSSDELEHLYQRVSQYLKPDGLFVIHTFPNLWYYQYEYPRQKKIAASVGEYLPEQPRTSYEMLMHINEQSPRVLNKQLSKYFPQNLVWFGDPSNPGGSLVNKFSKREICAAPSLFAIASHQSINQEQLKQRLQMSPLPALTSGDIEFSVINYPPEVAVNSEFNIQVKLTNNTSYHLNSYGNNPIHISYHWLDSQANNYLVFEGERTKIFPPLEAKEYLLENIAATSNYRAKVMALPKRGNYILRVTLVQELVRWFEQEPTNLREDIFIKIV
jgi:cyclopropane fatty-acyl-phospholipid synthase-like methyltransferase